MQNMEKAIKGFEKFNEELREFGHETGEIFVTLYEDINTTRRVANFRLYKNGKLKWVEFDLRMVKGKLEYMSQQEVEQMYDADEAMDYLKFWRANLRRAKKYWSMGADTLDRLSDRS